MIAEARLRDGTRALIWDVLPSDREAIREGYEHLSEESRFHRFLSGVPHLTPSLLEHLVDEVDGVDHIALALVVIDEDGNGTPAGVGRIIRYQDRPEAADVAVTVLDEWQGRGIATAILAELIRRRPSGVKRIVTTIAADNEPSIALVRQIGPTQLTPVEPSRLDVVVELEPDAPEADVSGSASADVAVPEPGSAESNPGDGAEQGGDGRQVQGRSPLSAATPRP